MGILLVSRKGKTLKSNRSRKNSAFTLIELLVVIAIIAILAAILFPVFAQAREKARQTTCLSNEKEMGLGLMQYVQDYDESYPYAWFPMPNGDNYDWSYAVGPYIKNGATVNNNGFYLGGIWWCPSNPGEQDNEYHPNANVILSNGGWNGCVPEQLPPLTLAQVDTPASTAAIWEVGALKGQGWNWINGSGAEWFWTSSVATDAVIGTDLANAQDNDTSTGWGAGSMHPRYRHSGNANFVYCDGHAKAVHKGQLKFMQNIYVKASGCSNPW